MTDFNYGMANRELIKDNAVVEEFDRLIARLKGFLRGFGQTDVESGLEDGKSKKPGTTTGDTTQTGKWVQAIKVIEVNADITALSPGDSALLRMLPTNANRLVHGIGETINGMRLTIYVPASASYTLTLKHESATADVPYRLSLVGQQDIETVVGEARAYDLIYDSIAARWIQLGGSSAIAAAVHSSLTYNATTTGTDADLLEKTLWTYSLPASTLANAGDLLRIMVSGSCADTATGKRVRLYFGATVIADSYQAASSTLRDDWTLTAYVIRTGAATQVSGGIWWTERNAIASPTTAAPAETLSGAITIKVTGLGDNVANSTQFKMCFVEKVSA